MGVLHKYMFSALLVILGLTYAHGYDSRTSRKFDRLERKIETITIELYEVKADLREEKNKTINLEIKLNELMDGQKVTAYDDKDSNKEVDTVKTDPEQRVYNAFYDEKQERKVFENHVKSILKDEKVKMEMKINTLNETLTTNIETQLNTLQDKGLHRVTELNDYIASIKELTSNVKQNQISLVYVEATLVELNDSCHDKEPDEPPIANAGSDQTVQLPTNTAKLFGDRSTDDQGIVEYRWSVSSTTGRDPRMQDSNKAVLGLSNLEEGDYVMALTVVDKLGQRSSDSARVRVSPAANRPPVADAGRDYTLTLPENRVTLYGSRGTDDKRVVDYSWEITSGSTRGVRLSESGSNLDVTGLKKGEYEFTLTVRDQNGLTDTDTARVVIKQAANRPPVADAGRDYTLTLPKNRVTLDGSRSTDDKRVVDYSWEITAGSTRGVRLSEYGSNLDVTGLKEGAYEFTLTVRDQNGLRDTDTARVVVTQGPKDCLEVLNQNKNNVNGVYNVRSPSSGLVYPVYCDMTTDGGGWTIFQKRFDGSLDFYLTFKEYEDGFGDVNAEFWMGLKRIHEMTANHNTELRIHLTAADGSTAYQTFQNFSVSPGPDYKIHVGLADGTAGDEYGITYDNGARFSTKDKDVDGNSYTDCAESYHGGWWYTTLCGYVNLNGDYAIPGTQSSYHRGYGGVVYYSFKERESLKSTTMMFRRK